jgi:NADH-quinone oxidoreductase subunit M
MLERALFGPPKPRWAHVTDASPVEAVAPILLVAAIVVVGVYPSVLTDVLGTGASQLLARFGP